MMFFFEGIKVLLALVSFLKLKLQTEKKEKKEKTLGPLFLEKSDLPSHLWKFQKNPTKQTVT